MPRRPKSTSSDPRIQEAGARSREREPKDAKRSPPRIPQPSRPPQNGRFGTIESWQRFEIALKNASETEEEKQNARWPVIIWMWFEALVRAKLTREERLHFSGDLFRYRHRYHDYLLGLRRLSRYGMGFSGDPPNVKQTWAVREFNPNQHIDPEPESLYLCIDLTQPSTVLVKEFATMIQKVCNEQKIRRITQSGKRYSLAKLVEALWLHDEKERKHVKWEAVSPSAKMFSDIADPGHRAGKIANLCGHMLATAKQGQGAFISEFY